MHAQTHTCRMVVPLATCLNLLATILSTVTKTDAIAAGVIIDNGSIKLNREVTGLYPKS